jgi:hypothetical protein
MQSLVASTEPNSRFVLRGISMVRVALSLIPFLAVTLRRFVFTGMGREWLLGEIDAPRPRQNGLLEQGLYLLDPVSLTLVAGDLENRADGADPVDRKYRAQCYLRRIVALTGATQIGGGYTLHVSTTRFQVCDRYVRRMREVNPLQCVHEETCFYPAHKEMPKAEQIATALLQLKNNPALFDRWAAQNHVAFKADGQVFTRAR